VELAYRFATQKGYDRAGYKVRASKKNDEWQIFFRRSAFSKARPGDFFTVYVDDKSRSVRRLVEGK
jgi:hypothetical protein